MILLLGLLWAALILSFVIFIPYSNYFGPSPAIFSWIGTTAGLATIGIPVFLLMMWLTQWFSDYRLSNKIKVPLRIGWILSFFICGFMIFEIVMDHNETVKVSTQQLMDIPHQSIHIESNTQKKMDGITKFFSTKLDKNGLGLINDDIKVMIKKAEGEDLIIEKQQSARGKNQEIAKNRANNIKADFSIIDNTILLPDYFYVHKSNKLRDQHVTFTIYIPEGKEVSFGPNVNVHSWEGFEESCNCDESKYKWIMGKNGLYSNEWLAKYRATKTIDLPSISNLNLEGNFNVSIKKGNTNKAILSGRKKDLDKIEYIPTENTVSFIKEGHFYSKPTLSITTKDLNSINATTISEMNITGFNQEAMEIIFDSRGELNAYIDVENLRCELKGGGNTTLIGSGYSMAATLSYAKLNAEKYKAKKIEISGDSKGESKVYASELILFDEDLLHELKIFGSPITEKIGDQINSGQ